jgi:hypothetical protein
VGLLDGEVMSGFEKNFKLLELLINIVVQYPVRICPRDTETPRKELLIEESENIFFRYNGEVVILPPN